MNNFRISYISFAPCHSLRLLRAFGRNIEGIEGIEDERENEEDDQQQQQQQKLKQFFIFVFIALTFRLKDE